MNKRCDTCIHYEICKSWTQPQYRCGNYLQAPPCKVGDLLFVPVLDEYEGEWHMDVIPVTDVGQRDIFGLVFLTSTVFLPDAISSHHFGCMLIKTDFILRTASHLRPAVGAEFRVV